MRMSAMRHAMTLTITTESLTFGTFVVDDSQRIISWNDHATRTLGFDSDMTLGRTCEEMLALLQIQDVPVCPESSDVRSPAGMPSSDPHVLRPYDNKHDDKHDDKPMRVRVITQHGTPRWLDLSILQARTMDGSACIVHIFRDVTEDTERQARSAVAADVSPHPGSILHLPVGASDSVQPDDTLKLTVEHLTRREHEVLELLAQGMATVEIATALGISRVTARNHVTRIIEKLGVKTRLQAVLTASHRGLI
jgi:DNA-binding CsgD family transcriptional regulator